MDALRRALALSIAVIAVLCVVPASWDDADAAGRLDGLMLYEISPDNPEGISLYNYGNEPVDLRDYMVADQPSVSGGREGSLHFTQEIIVQPGTYVVLADADPETSMFTKGEDVYLTSSGNDFGIETEGSFNMANGGDDIYLLSKDGTVLDALFYGDKEVDGSQYWTGEPVEIPSDGYIQRTGGTDTDSASDWSVPGTLGLEFDPDLRYGAEVTPFLFPDHGGIPVYDTLESARVSIDIEIYMITSANLYALLIEKEHQGVEVRLLLEGNNINDNLGPYLPYIQQLVEAGGEVRMIGVGSDGVADRFNLVHAKYAVVDGGTVIVTSENWTEDNLNGHLDDDPYDSTSGDGNRGWGAVVDSDGYAGFMSSVFENDWSMDYGDVKTFDELYGTPETGNALTYQAPDDIPSGYLRTFSAEVTPVLSNDDSYEALEYYISTAEERFYSQQQSFSTSFQNMNKDGLIGSIAERTSTMDLDCRLIFGSEGEGFIDTINGSSKIKAAVMTKPYVHNKGIISDDHVWVSSVNWTPTSFHQNREVAVVIHSAEVADYFAGAFLNDFDRCYDYDGLRVDITEIQDTYEAGKEVTFTVDVVNGSGNYTYYWDFGDGTEVRETDEPRVCHTPVWNGEEAAVYNLTVRVVDQDDGVEGEAHATYVILKEGVQWGDQDQPGEGDQDQSEGDGVPSFLSEYMYILAPLLVIILAVVGALSRSRKKSKRK